MAYNLQAHQDVTQTPNQPTGFSGVKHKSSPYGSDSGPEQMNDLKRPSYATRFARPDAAWDGKEQQKLQTSMKGLPLTGAPVRSEAGNKYTKMPSNRSGSQRVGE